MVLGTTTMKYSKFPPCFLPFSPSRAHTYTQTFSKSTTAPIYIACAPHTHPPTQSCFFFPSFFFFFFPPAQQNALDLPLPLFFFFVLFSPPEPVDQYIYSPIYSLSSSLSPTRTLSLSPPAVRRQRAPIALRNLWPSFSLPPAVLRPQCAISPSAEFATLIFFFFLLGLGF
jgi:hypothetical protein